MENLINLPRFCNGLAAILAATSEPASAVLEFNSKTLPNFLIFSAKSLSKIISNLLSDSFILFAKRPKDLGSCKKLSPKSWLIQGRKMLVI